MFRSPRFLACTVVPVLLALSSIASADSISSLPLAAGAQFSAKLDGTDFTATWVSASSSTMGGKNVLNLSGHIGEGSTGAFISCGIVEPKVGTIAFGGSGFVRTGCHYQGGTDVFNDGFRFDSGSVEITTLDANTVSGHFTMSDGKNMAHSRAVKSIEGSFTKIPLGQPSRTQ